MNGGCDFKQCLRGSIVAIDKSNKTHLTASKDGRSTIFDIIVGECACTTMTELQAKLRKVDADGTIDREHLIAKISKDIDSTKEGQTRSNLSFASKFCAYADLYLNGERDRYSKYDNVVSNHLISYVDAFLDGKLDVDKERITITKKQIYYSSPAKKNQKTKSNIYWTSTIMTAKVLGKL